MAPGTSLLLSWISHQDTVPVDDVEAAHVETVPLGEVNQVLPNSIHFPLHKSLRILLIDNTVICNNSVLVEVVDDVAVGRVGEETLDAHGDLPPPGGPDEAGLDIVVYLDNVVFAETV